MRIVATVRTSFLVLLVQAIVFVTPAGAIEPAIVDGKSLKLQGIGLREQLSEELYIGALFTEYRSVEPEILAEASNTKRMELRIVTAKITSKRFGRFWAETIRINNPSKAVREQQKSIIKFNDFFKDSLFRGDQIVIDHVQGEGTTVYLNGTKLGQLYSDSFMPLLLQTWIGPRPPSDSFKNTILGGFEDGLELIKQEYAVLVPTRDRIAETANWPDQSTSGIEELELVVPEPRLTKMPKVSAAQKEALERKKAEEERLAQEKAAAEKAAKEKAAKEKAAREEAARKKREAAEKRKAELAAKRKKEREIKAAVQAALKKEREEFARKQEAEREKAKREAAAKQEEQAKKEVFAISNQYEQSLVEWVGKRVTYPPSAFKRGLEGQGIFKIRISRDGAVQMVKVEKSTRSQLLDREAVKAIRRLSPFPPMPDDLPGSDFTFVTPVTFKR